MMMTQGTWQRDERVIAYLSERRARYPSITRAPDGRQLILFTHQTAPQEQEGRGDLRLLRSTEDGRWWFDAQTAYESVHGEPRAFGTMTALNADDAPRSSRIIAPFAEVDDRAGTSVVRLLLSEDGGSTFLVSSLTSAGPLSWAAPHGRPFYHEGDLVMSLFGALSADDLARTRHSCGLLRSRDGGRTWGEWSLIACGSSGGVSYEYGSVLPLANGRMVAVLTARRTQRTGDSPQVLVRTYSEDGGRTWSEPEQLCVGAWPALVMVDDETCVCAYTVWCGWGSMNLLVSHDGFATFTQDQAFLEHGWLPIPAHYPKTSLYPDKELELESIGEGSFRPFWAYNPIPLPPVVPHLQGDWEAGHYGFGAVLPLSPNRLVVVLGNRQQGSLYNDPSHECDVPIELERIEAISFDRLAPLGSVAPRLAQARAPSRWEIAESWTPQQWRETVHLPPAGEGFVLASGRWVRCLTSSDVEDHHVHQISGRARGYWIHTHQRRITWEPPRFQYCDDAATRDPDEMTWVNGRLVDPDPLAALSCPSGQCFQGPDGTVVTTSYGYVNDRDMSDHVYCCALCRSRDDGLTWGDWSVFGRDRRDRQFSYCEPTILPMEDGTWVAFMRTEAKNQIPWMGAMMTRCVSNDGGYTWSPPQACVPGSQPALIVLGDGGLALIVRSTGRQKSGVYFSYDQGASWDYALAGPYNTSDAGMLDANRLWIYAGNEVVIYRRTD